MTVLPQAGILANNLLEQRLGNHGYYRVIHMPGLRQHVLHMISLTLVVYNFGIIYVGHDHADHIMSALEIYHGNITIDWQGSLYCGISTKQNNEKWYVDISIPGYFNDDIHHLSHIKPKKRQHQPNTSP